MLNEKASSYKRHETLWCSLYGGIVVRNASTGFIENLAKLSNRMAVWKRIIREQRSDGPRRADCGESQQTVWKLHCKLLKGLKMKTPNVKLRKGEPELAWQTKVDPMSSYKHHTQWVLLIWIFVTWCFKHQVTSWPKLKGRLLFCPLKQWLAGCRFNDFTLHLDTH